MKDKDVYIASLKKLVENLNSSIVSSDADIVVALSRKGPRLLEYLRKNMGLKELSVMTEHALPFLFENILSKSDKKFRIFIVDDAIYFGSTILALKEEIESYIKVYGLEERVHIEAIFSCIKDKGSLDFGDIEVKAIKDARPGYGHFFVKEVMKNLRSLGKSLEVEFPEICYETKYPVDIYKLHSSLQEIFGEEKVYMIDSPLGIKSISVLLSGVRESTFRKLRIFVDGCHVSVVSIAPELTSALLGHYHYVSFGKVLDVNILWSNIASELEAIGNLMVENNLDKRNVDRTAVVLLNYFSSMDTYCYFRNNVENAIQVAAGEITEWNIDNDNLSYLLGDQFLVNKIHVVWEEALRDEKYYTIPILNEQEYKAENITIETSMLSNIEINSLSMSNLSQVFNSISVEGALSSMFFNQTLMIERWSRYINASRQERLRFGYTYQYLWNFIWANANNISAGEISQANMHRWVDTQIDNGSIVPQYILDKVNFKWVRVFRPGENEDFLISHLGRFVVHIFNQMLENKTDKQVGKVIRKNLDGVLAATFHHFQDKLEQEELVHCLWVEPKKHELFLQIADKQVNLVQFLETKNIFKAEDGNFVRLAARIEENEFSQFTTLSKELTEAINGYVQSILAKMGNKPQATFTFSNTINYFLADMVRVDLLQTALEKMGMMFEKTLYAIYAEQIDKEKIDCILKNLIDSYQSELACYEINISVLLEDNSNIKEELRPYFWKVVQMIAVINIPLLLFYRDKKSLYVYIEQELSNKAKESLNAWEVFDYLLSMKNTEVDLLHDINLKNKMEAYLRQTILVF